jgi:hypothetical protein
MRPVLFDSALAPTLAARKIVTTAPGTLFPELLPEPKPTAAAQTDPCGTSDMLTLLEEL